MAERAERDDGNKKRGDKPQPPKGPKGNMLYASGPQEKRTLTLVTDGKVDKGAEVTFWVGQEMKEGDSSANPFMHRIANPGGAVGAIEVDPTDGIAKITVGGAGADKVKKAPVFDLMAVPEGCTHVIGRVANTSTNQVAIGKPGSGESETITKPGRLTVRVGDLSRDRFNPVTIELRDAKGAFEAGQVEVTLGQRFRVDGLAGVFNGSHVFPVNATGRLFQRIKLASEDTTGIFRHIESGEIHEKSLLKEP